jgi:hypothetical protein
LHTLNQASLNESIDQAARAATFAYQQLTKRDERQRLVIL